MSIISQISALEGNNRKVIIGIAAILPRGQGMINLAEKCGIWQPWTILQHEMGDITL